MGELCNACSIERIGCGCDGSLDLGCFYCTPEDHKRPPCPPDCPNFVKPPAFNMSDESSVRMSVAAPISTSAVEKKSQRDANEELFRERVKKCVVKPEGHTQLPPPEDFTGTRLYSVTTLAASPRYGGTVTVAVCDSFERAREIVETNEGDIWECSYMLAVIEPVAVNRLYYFFPDERYWYRWDLKSGKYEPIEVPPGYENLIGFGIG